MSTNTDSRRAIVTGGAGFVGSHLVDELFARGYEVTVIDDLSTGRRSNVADGARFVELDIADGDAVASAFAEAAPEVVFHLAAQSSVTTSVKDPRRDLESNVVGTFNVCESA